MTRPSRDHERDGGESPPRRGESSPGGVAPPTRRADSNSPPSDLVDRRAFVVRLGALGALAAGGVRSASTAAGLAAQPPDAFDATRFFGRVPRPRLSASGVDPTELTAAEAGALFRDGRLEPAQYLEAYLERVRRWDEVYLAFNHVGGEEALDRARSLGSAAPRGLLHGIPVAVKDNFHTAGVPTTANSHIFQGFVPDEDAAAVARLIGHGAVLTGKTQMGPLATTRALTPDGRITTVNAWAPGDPGVSPGGSSSGSATAVAARMSAAAIGTQTGGSVTVPSAAQGLTGLKPTLGRVSLRGVIPLTYTRDHVGPLARDVRDAALLLQAMAGPDPRDPRTLGLPPVPDLLTAGVPAEESGTVGGPSVRWRTRLGVPRGWTDASGERGANRRDFLQVMEEAGVELVELRLPSEWDELTSSRFNAVRLPERTEPFMKHLREDVRLFGVSLSPWIQGLFLSGDEYLTGQRARLALLRLTLSDPLARCDVMVQESHLPFDMVGLPLLTFPIGTRRVDGSTLPDGVLLGAGPFAEERLLAVGAAYQARSEWHRARPADPDADTEARLTDPRRSRGRLGVDEVGEAAE